MILACGPPNILDNGKCDIIDTRPVRHDGTSELTGLLLYSKALRSPHAHTRIKSIDTIAVAVPNTWHPLGARGV